MQRPQPAAEMAGLRLATLLRLYSSDKVELMKIRTNKHTGKVRVKVKAKIENLVEVEAIASERNMAAVGGDGGLTLLRFGPKEFQRGQYGLQNKNKIQKILLEPIKGNLFAFVLAKDALEVVRLEGCEDIATLPTGTVVSIITSPVTDLVSVAVDCMEGNVFLLDTSGAVRQFCVSLEGSLNINDLPVPLQLSSFKASSIFFSPAISALYLVSQGGATLFRCVIHGSIVASVEEVKIFDVFTNL